MHIHTNFDTVISKNIEISSRSILYIPLRYLMNNNFKPTASGCTFSAWLQYPGAHSLQYPGAHWLQYPGALWLQYPGAHCLQHPGAHWLHSRVSFDISHTLKILSEKTFTNIRGKCCVQCSTTKVTKSAGHPNISV